MSTQPPKSPAPPPAPSWNLLMRAIAAGAGAALGAVIYDIVLKQQLPTWTGVWFGPLCAGLGAILGMAFDFYVLSSREEEKEA